MTAAEIPADPRKPLDFQSPPPVLRTPKYEARVLDDIENGRGCWKSTRVGVFVDGVQVGEYARNYPNLYRTFFPFRAGDEWLALYSKSYASTRIMSLPSCIDVGGEEPAANGFCPVEYFVPRYSSYIVNGMADVVYEEIDDEEGDPYQGFASFGLISGCCWGDDTSWKIQHLDLSKAASGVITRSEKFGYIALPRGVHLRKAVCLAAADVGLITIATGSTFNLADGSKVEW